MLESLSRPGRTVGQKAALLSDYGLLLQGWTGALGVGWNTPAWSLSCEFFFYLCFPLLFLWMRNAAWPKLAGAFADILAIPIMLAHAGVPAVWKPIHHLSDFLAGIAAASIYDLAGPGRRVRGRGFLLYLPALVAGRGADRLSGGAAGHDGRSQHGAASAQRGAVDRSGAGGWHRGARPSTSAAGYLGKASYSMYVLHVPLLWWYTRYAFIGWARPPYTVTALVYLAVVIAASIVVFELVESPANRWIRRGAASRALSFGRGFAAGKTQVGFFGRLEHRQHGIHFRDFEQYRDARADAGHGELSPRRAAYGPSG